MSNLPNSQQTDTQVFFNGYFSQPIQVSEATWNQIFGYFYTLTQSIDAASSLSQSVITLTYNNNLDPLDLIKQFQNNPNTNNTKNLLISFFNNAKGATSKLGYNKNTSVAPNISRNILP
jgi:hypothetical protein